MSAVTAKKEQTKISTKAEVDFKEINTQQTKDSLNNFIFTEEVGKALDLAFITGENVILYGKGGFGKSEMAEAYLRGKKVDIYIKTMGNGTTTDSLFGGIDIKEFNDTGKIEYLVENSFMNHEYVILEELFDAPDYILEQLKDILTSKVFRNGTQTFPIKTKLIICCTNKSREEFSKNDSLKALMERFPLELKVEWDNYTRDTYDKLFRHVLKSSDNELCYILEKLAQNGSVISPRTAIKAAKIVNSCGIDCLDFIADFSGKNTPLVKAEIEKFKNVKILTSYIKRIDELITESASIVLDTLENIKHAKTLLKEIETKEKELKTKKVDDEMISMIEGKKVIYAKYIIQRKNKINEAIEQ